MSVGMNVPFRMEEAGENYEKRELVFCEGRIEGEKGGFKPEIDIVEDEDKDKDEDGKYSVIVKSCEKGVVQERYTLRGCAERHVHVLWRSFEEEEPEEEPLLLFDDYARWSFPGVSVAGVEPGAFMLEGNEGNERNLSDILETLSLPPIKESRPVTCGGSGSGVTCEVVWEGSRASVYVTRRVAGRVTVPLLSSSTKHEVAVLGRVGGKDPDSDPDTLVHGVLVTLEGGTTNTPSPSPSVRETLFVHTPFAVRMPAHAEPPVAGAGAGAEPPLPFHATLLQPGEGGGSAEVGGGSSGSASYMHPVLEWDFGFGGTPPPPPGCACACTAHVHVRVPKEYIVDPHTLPQHCHVMHSPVSDIELPAYKVNSSTATTTLHSTALHGSLQLHLRYIAGGNGNGNDTLLLPPVHILPFWECPLDDETAVAVKSSFYTDPGRLLYPLNDHNYSNRLYALPIVSLRAQMVTGPARGASVDLATTVIVAMASFYLLFKLFKGVRIGL
ncbi:hypothetical protein CANINC_001421 [Pichia inconspicua]|uniref:Protein PBN1 n=1 Tax=Pichia inconspicua TaxID=52247 RepID=A0A4V4NFY6_9ASCO|nr:hypothetical protein CANINC_001421 [[Candida] inconspicua]